MKAARLRAALAFAALAILVAATSAEAATYTVHVENDRGILQYAAVNSEPPQGFDQYTDVNGNATVTAQLGGKIRVNRGLGAPEYPGKDFLVDASLPSSFTVVLPHETGPSNAPALSDKERWLIGQINAQRAARGNTLLYISTTLTLAADAEAHDAALSFPNYTWIGSRHNVGAQDWGWPGDRTGNILADCPCFDPRQVLAHWDGSEGNDEARKIAEFVIDHPFNYVGIGDGGGGPGQNAWIIELARRCGPAQLPRCGITTDLGDPNAWSPPAASGAPGAGALDKSGPQLSLGGKRRQSIRRRAIRFNASCDEPCTLTASASLSVPKASKVFRLRTLKRSLRAGRRVTLKLKLSKKALRAAKRALRKRKRVVATVSAKATDATGNASATSRRVGLVR